jgi:hypothetical protein
MPVLLESELVQVPMTIGFIRPAVILPVGWENWDDWKLRAVLLHELAHVRRVDWGIAVVATAAKCAYWLNPVSWVLERQLLQLAEQSSDDATLSNIQNPTYYAEILLEFAVAAQNGGRLMKRGVAMAQSNMKARIERVLGNPKTGTGIVNVAGWILVMMSAAPVIYSSAALQVKSETVKSALPTYAAELGRNPMSQTLPAGPQAAPTPAPATAPQSRQNLSNPAAHLSGPFQMELENRKLQREYEALKQKLAEAQLVANQASTGPAPELQDTARIGGSVAFLQDELKKTDEQLRTLQAAMLQQSQVNPPTAPASALLDLPDNEDDLLGYLKALASLRANPNAGSYMVSFTGIQGRIISMKVSGPTFSFGCESCSFFVGESVVSSAASARPGPGLLVRLSSDGNELAITCRATNCWSGDQGDNTRPGGMRRMVFGDSEIFPVSKLPNVVISKD